MIFVSGARGSKENPEAPAHPGALANQEALTNPEALANREEGVV